MTDPLYILYAVFSVVVGLTLGSFWNVAISRWPEDRSVIPRSACPSCGSPVTARDNVPVLSWVLLRGACRSCGWKIPGTYPLVEILGGMLGFLVFRRFVPGPESLDLAHGAAAVSFFVFTGALVIATYVDIRHRIIPDEVSIYAVLAGILGSVVLETVGYSGWLAIGWKASMLGAVLGALFLGSMAGAAMFLTGREALGWGDVKLLAMIGSFLGPHPALFAILLASSLTSSIVGIVVTVIVRRRVYMPFGPALAGWALVYMLYGDVLIPRFIPGLAIYL